MRQLLLASPSLLLAAWACQPSADTDDTGVGGGTPLLPVVTSVGPGPGPGPGAGGGGGAAGPGGGGNTSVGGNGTGGNGTGGNGTGGNGTGGTGTGGGACSTAPGLSDLVINEIHSSPDSSSHDVNCDATSSTDDEFIEIVNVSNNALDMTGVELTENGTVRHTFTGCLASQRAIVVYNKQLTPMCGAGVWGDTQGVAADTSFTLTNSGGEQIGLQSSAGTHDTVTTINLSSNPRTSMTRSPDGTGTFVEHDTVGGAFSVGTCLDGGLFPCD